MSVVLEELGEIFEKYKARSAQQTKIQARRLTGFPPFSQNSKKSPACFLGEIPTFVS